MEKLRILAVDDEEGVLKVIQEVLYNHDLTTETSPLKAAERIQKEIFDIFIIDFQMSQINGIELLEEIQQEYKNRKYVSIFCTAFGTIHIFKSELVKGLFHYYIEKPFKIDSLKRVMQKAIITLERMKSNVIQKVINE